MASMHRPDPNMMGLQIQISLLWMVMCWSRPCQLSSCWHTTQASTRFASLRCCCSHYDGPFLIWWLSADAYTSFYCSPPSNRSHCSVLRFIMYVHALNIATWSSSALSFSSTHLLHRDHSTEQARSYSLNQKIHLHKPTSKWRTRSGHSIRQHNFFLLSGLKKILSMIQHSYRPTAQTHYHNNLPVHALVWNHLFSRHGHHC